MHAFILETPRLLLRQPTANDAEAAFIWTSDPAVNRFMPYALYTDVEDVRAWLKSTEACTDEYHFGFVRKSDGLLIGTGSIGPDEAYDAWCLGYNLRADCWNQGYATEAARAMIDFARREFGVRDFTATHAKGNPASGRVMERCGLHYVEDTEYSRFDGSEAFPACRYELHIDA